MNPTARRIAASALAWTVGAAASVAVSLVALSSINAGAAAGPPQQLMPDGLTKTGSGLGTAGSPGDPSATRPGSGDPTPAASRSTKSPDRPDPTVSSVQRQLSSPGGTVIARCTGTTAYLVSWSPAQGYRTDHVQRGPAPDVGLTFRNTTDQTGLQIEIHCLAGTPVLDESASQDEPGDH